MGEPTEEIGAMTLNSPPASSPNIANSFISGKPIASSANVSRIIKIELMDDEDDDKLEEGAAGTGGGDDNSTMKEGGASNNEPPTALSSYSNDKAPVPGNCCGFSTVGCAKFWSIFNLSQLFMCWIFVCVNPSVYFGSPKPGDDALNLVICFDGGTPGAEGTKLAMQILLLLGYTTGSILFTLANFPPKSDFEHRQLFTKVYFYSFLCFLLTFAIPFIFHVFVSECFYPISLLAWIVFLMELGVALTVLYFSWRIVKIFLKYLVEEDTVKPSDTGNESDEDLPELNSDDDIKEHGFLDKKFPKRPPQAPPNSMTSTVEGKSK